MDKQVLRLRAHLDQTRSEMRHLVNQTPEMDLVALIKTCAAGRLDDLDERHQLLVGMLAIVAIFDLKEGDQP